MGLIKLNCSNCGATLEFDEHQKTGFCSHCGTKHVLEDVKNTTINNFNNEFTIEKANFINGPSEENLLDRAKQFKKNGDLKNALIYVNKVLDINSKNMEAQRLLEEAIFINGRYLSYFKINDIDEKIGKINSEKDLKLKEEMFKQLVISLDFYVTSSKHSYSKCLQSVLSILNKWKSDGVNAAFKLSENLRKQDLNIVSSQSKENNQELKIKPEKELKKQESEPKRLYVILLLVIVLLGIIVGYSIFVIVNYVQETKGSNGETRSKEISVGSFYTHNNISYKVNSATINDDNSNNVLMNIKIHIKNLSHTSEELSISTFYLITPNGSKFLPISSVQKLKLRANSEEILTIAFEILNKEKGDYKLYLDLFMISADPYVLINN